MSLLSALTTGTSGLQTSSTDLSVIGDNIANSNTIGFKAGRAAFQDQLLQQVIGSSGGGQIGLGSRLQAIQRLVTQGAIATTGNATDLALDGPGLFVLRGSQSGVDAQYYSRAGQFKVDDLGYLTNLQGLRVQGYPTAVVSSARGGLGDLQVGNATMPAVATSTVTIRANLSESEPLKVFDPLNPSGTSAPFTSTVTLYDTLGKDHTVNVFWTHTGAGTWEFHAMTDGANVTGGTPNVPSEIATGQLTFDTNGALVSETQTSNFLPNNATQPQPLVFNFGDPTALGGTGLNGVTQFDGAGSTTFVGQDGNSFGTLASIQFNLQGEIVGAFTNGESQIIGQVAVAKFTAEDRLMRSGGNLMLESVESGQPTIGDPGSGGRASVVAGALEQSNVDLAEEFVRMIAAQRGFQANSKTITTADQLLQELMQLKR